MYTLLLCGKGLTGFCFVISVICYRMYWL